MNIRIVLILLLASLSIPSLAATQTATLSVEGMTCAACPLTVKAALNRVEGVIEVQVNYREREALVTFDNTKASPDTLTQATANAGFPAEVKTLETLEETP